MSVLTTWSWTNNARRLSKAPGRPGTMAASPRKRTRLPKDPSDPRLSRSPELLSLGCSLCCGMVQAMPSAQTRFLVSCSQRSAALTTTDFSLHCQVSDLGQHCVYRRRRECGPGISCICGMKTCGMTGLVSIFTASYF